MINPYHDLEINTKSQLSLLEACRKRNPSTKIIFASTRQVYGKPMYLPVDERHPLQPIDINGANKLAAEWYHALYHNVYGIRTVSLRMTNTYGPRLLIKHDRQGFMGWFIRQVMDGKEIEIFGDGKQLRDLNYIDDAIEAFLICAYDDSLDGQVFNLGNSQAISLEEIAKLLIKINGSGDYRFIPFPDERKKIDIGHYHSCYLKFQEATGWIPCVSYEEGFRETLDYYKRNKKYYLE
jgi:nucleoside-diphosphate-sugar epimerase